MKISATGGLSLILFILLSIGTARAEGEMRIAWFNWPPLIESSAEGAGPVGPFVDYYNEIAEKMGRTIVWLGPYPVKRAIHMLELGKVDMVSCLTRNPDRETVMSYPERPFYVMSPVVCVRSEMDIDRLDNWNGLKKTAGSIGIHDGTALYRKLKHEEAELKLRHLKDERGNTIEFALGLLLDGRIDAFIHSDRAMTDKALADMKAENKVKSLDAPLPDRPMYVVFSKKRQDLLKEYNAISGE